MSTTPLPCSTVLDALHWRYATKAFDPTKTIPAEQWKTLESTLLWSPSSFGLQPWKFIVVTDKAMREKLQAHSWNQTQVTQCSHYVVFAAVQNLDETHVDNFLAYTAEKRGATVESLKGYRGAIVGCLKGGIIGSPAWAAHQAYIALGTFMTAAAMLKIDTCPMEGFLPAEYNKLLGLTERGLSSVVCCAAGYRSESDKYATAIKVRYPAEQIIEHI
jgi:nitroreductase